MKSYIDMLPEIQAALAAGTPVVALESTILSHGMPWPGNLGFAAEMEKTIRGEGALPATVAIIDGRIKVGLSRSELEQMCSSLNVGKVSRRNIPVYVSTLRTGATTVSATMLIAERAGIRVFATGGIGGVHRGGENSMDISADLQELAHTPVAVVCSGAKQLLDMGRTLEYLETMGVPVIGNGTIEFPAFYCRDSGYKLDYAAKDEREIAKIINTKWAMGLSGGILVCNPIPHQFAMDFDDMEGVIDTAREAAEAANVHGKDLTPFMLNKITELTGGESIRSNVQLAINNARCAARIAVAMALDIPQF